MEYFYFFLKAECSSKALNQWTFSIVFLSVFANTKSAFYKMYKYIYMHMY